jgi:hypothetical protein
LVGGLGPFEGLGILVATLDEGADVGLQLPDRGVNDPPEPLSGELSELALDLIDPRRRSGRSRRIASKRMRMALEQRLRAMTPRRAAR